METILKAKNTSLTEAMKTYIEDKIPAQVGKIMGKQAGLEYMLVIEIGLDTRHHRKGAIWQTKATLSLGKNVLRAEARGEHFQEAIDLLEEEFVREVKKSKGKQSAETRRGARRAKKNATIAKAARFYRKGRIREEGI